MTLRPGEVRVHWGAPAPLCAHARSLSLLSPAEWRRAEGMRDAAAEGFVAARGLLRAMLADEGLEAASRIRIESEVSGRPRAWLGNAELPVSVTHTRGLVACAVGRVEALGVDGEPVDRRVRALALARRFFAESEAAELAGLEAAEANRRFLALWTSKEALGKALGGGVSPVLSHPLFRFSGEGRLEGGAAGFHHELVALDSGHWLAVAALGARAIRIEAGMAAAAPVAGR